MEAILAVFLPWILILALKFIIASAKARKLMISALAKPGGMPSAHTGLMSALATVVGVKEGTRSTFFLIAVVLGVIVMYDSVGRRLFQRHTVTEVFVGAVLGIVFALLFSVGLNS